MRQLSVQYVSAELAEEFIEALCALDQIEFGNGFVSIAQLRLETLYASSNATLLGAEAACRARRALDTTFFHTPSSITAN